MFRQKGINSRLIKNTSHILNKQTINELQHETVLCLRSSCDNLGSFHVSSRYELYLFKGLYHLILILNTHLFLIFFIANPLPNGGGSGGTEQCVCNGHFSVCNIGTQCCVEPEKCCNINVVANIIEILGKKTQTGSCFV